MNFTFMSKVVLLAINAKYVHSALSVWVLAGGVYRYAHMPHDVNIAEATIHHPNIEIADKVAAYQPDIIGVSTYIWNAKKLPALLKLLRERLPDVIIVLGGPEASHNAKHWLSCGADFVLPGEGEYTFPALLDALAAVEKCNKDQLKKRYEAQALSHTTSDKNQNTVSLPEALRGNEFEAEKPYEPIDPYTDAYFAALGGRIAYLETSRGCPFQCAFCLSAGSSVKYIPIETAKEQIYKLSRAQSQTIKLVDRTFNCNKDRAYELFEYIIELNTTRCFHFEVAADLFDTRLLELLKTAPAGRIQLEAGIQSYYEPTQKAAIRQMDIEKAEQNLRELLLGRNIHIHVDLIAGLPYETLPEFQNSFDRAYSIGAHTLQLGFLKLLHGSELRRQAGALGIQYSKEPPYEIKSSPWLAAEDIQTLKQAENALQHTHNKSRFLSALEYVLSVSGLRPFALYEAIGRAAPNHGTDLVDYAEQIYNFCNTLPGVDDKVLKDRMLCDWLSMVKGKNTPSFLKKQNNGHKQVAIAAKKRLGHTISRAEAAVLNSGTGVFVDSENRDPVTGLYRIYYTSDDENTDYNHQGIIQTRL